VGQTNSERERGEGHEEAVGGARSEVPAKSVASLKKSSPGEFPGSGEGRPEVYFYSSGVGLGWRVEGRVCVCR
jgi:hypothetical protein